VAFCNRIFGGENMRNISIFCKMPQFSRTPSLNYRHLIRGSSEIRGIQMSKYLGAKLNPTEEYENDLCIYIKPYELDNIKDGDYVDISDGNKILSSLRNRPGIGIIFSSVSGYEYIKTKDFKNKLVYIPQHHCNYERLLRDRKEINTIGVIGSPDSFQYPIKDFIEKLNEIGFNFISNYTFWNRNDVVEFYKQIDIQVSWNTDGYFNKIYKCPTRLINAASFGIPTVALLESYHLEFKDNYISINNIDEMIVEIKKLKDQNYYNQWSEKIIKPTEFYHISNIAEMYRRLL
jgi:hypothetical protein